MPSQLKHNLEFGREHNGYSHLGIPPGCPACAASEEVTTMATTPTRQPYDVYAKLEDRTGVLSVALGQWEDHGDRQAAGTALGAIDGMLRELMLMRGRLVSEVAARDA